MSVELVEVEIPFAGIEAIEVQLVTSSLPGLGTPIISATPPSNPTNGMQWIESGTNILSVWITSENAWIVPAVNSIPANALAFDGNLILFETETITYQAA